jgi:acetaldehyde dehydrogenase
VLCLTGHLDPGGREKVVDSIEEMIANVSEYVPGYRLKQPVQFTDFAADDAVHRLVPDSSPTHLTQVSVFLEVEGAAHYLPAYAGNLDIMTSAALRVAERLAARADTASTPAETARPAPVTR